MPTLAFCTHCGSKLGDDDRFCKSCGQATGTASTVPAGQTMQPSPVVAAPIYAPPPMYVQQQKTNGLAIASLILGILWVYWLGSLLALIFGLVAQSQIRAAQGQQAGEGMAIAGIVLGIVGLATLLLLIIVGVSVG